MTVALLVLSLVLAIFVIQNTERTNIEFFGWDATVPLAGALLLSSVLGCGVVGLVMYLRQRQFRRALMDERKKRDPNETRSSTTPAPRLDG